MALKNEKIKTIVREIIDHNWIYPVYQPIVSLKNASIIGYEALSRLEFEAQQMIGPINIESLFCEAEKSGLIWKLDYLCRKNAIKSFFQQNSVKDRKLFLNVCPGIMADPRFSAGFTRDYLLHHGTEPERIVFELTERQAIKDKEAFMSMVEHYKKQGFDIAIDDVGSAHSGLERICYSKPNYIKLDMGLIRNIHKSSIKASLVRGLSDFALCNNICLLAEGIESREELETLISLGVPYGQGFYLGYPKKQIGCLDEKIQSTILQINVQKKKNQSRSVGEFPIKDIATETLTVSPEKGILEIHEHIQNHPELPGVCVCREGRVIGTLTRERLLQILGGRYGFSLYQKKPINLIMSTEFLCVDGDMPIRAVSELAMKREDTELYDFIVVSRLGKYYGIVTIKDLLIHATQVNLQTAMAANPLTGLPGNNVIEREIENCIQENKTYTIFYLDLDNFKAYNDVYGFEKGDQVIKTMADVLQEYREKDSFVGHIGGDDFVLIVKRNVNEKYAHSIEAEFKKRAILLYNSEDRERGYIVSTNRAGEVEQFPLVTVTIVGITEKDERFHSQYELSQELAKRKKQKKKINKEKALFHNKH